MSDEIFRTAQGPQLSSLLDPAAMVRSLWARRDLTAQFARRDVAGKYRASYFGMLWTVFSPLLLLIVYTFIFSVVLRMKFGQTASGGHGDFAIKMFIGLLIFNVFSEVVNRAATLVVSHPNYVKKVVFPLEILVPAVLLSSLVTMAVGLGVWLVGCLILIGPPTATGLLLPVVLLPICLLTLGLGWLLAALGAFIRDISQIVGVITQVLFLCTPIFYPLDILDRAPAFIRTMIVLNPLTQVVVNARTVLLDGTMPNWTWWGGSMVGGIAVALFGYAFFMKSRRAFGDVL